MLSDSSSAGIDEQHVDDPHDDGVGQAAERPGEQAERRADHAAPRVTATNAPASELTAP